MPKGIIGKKLGMTQLFTENGDATPATVIQAGPCAIVQVKTVENEGYNSLQLGFLQKKPQRVNQPTLGHCQKSGTGPFYVLKEFRVDDAVEYSPGQEIRVDTVFKVGDFVDVTGTSKGRGFTGVVKRHGFRGAKRSHGTHEYFRHGGSIGASATPSRTFKGKKMPGHHGNKSVTVQNIQVLDIKAENNLLLLKGSVPGAINSVVTIREAVKRQRKKDQHGTS